MPEIAIATLPALKEWAAVCDLLLAGRQTLLLRKGGIDERGFWVEAEEFLLFPTGFHQHREKLRPEFADAAARPSIAPPPEGTARFPGVARVIAAVEVRRPEGLAHLADLHPYTEEQVAARLAFRPRKPLAALVVQAFPVEPPIEVPARDEFGGCVSWVTVSVPQPALGAPARAPEDLEAIAKRVRDTAG